MRAPSASTPASLREPHEQIVGPLQLGAPDRRIAGPLSTRRRRRPASAAPRPRRRTMDGRRSRGPLLEESSTMSATAASCCLLIGDHDQARRRSASQRPAETTSIVDGSDAYHRTSHLMSGRRRAARPAPAPGRPASSPAGEFRLPVHRPSAAAGCVAVCRLPSGRCSLRFELEADVGGRRRMRQRADRHELRAGGGQLRHPRQRHAAGDLDGAPGRRCGRIAMRMS